MHQPKNKKASGMASAASLFSSYRHKAKDREIAFTLTFEFFVEMTSQNCYLCGAKPAQVVKQRQRHGDYRYNGLDRVNNRRGYHADNVMPCCKICNRIKSMLTLEELREHVRKMLGHAEPGQVRSKLK